MRLLFVGQAFHQSLVSIDHKELFSFCSRSENRVVESSSLLLHLPLFFHFLQEDRFNRQSLFDDKFLDKALITDTATPEPRGPGDANDKAAGRREQDINLLFPS